MPSVRTTISCRLIAPLLIVASLAGVSSAASQQASENAKRLPTTPRAVRALAAAAVQPPFVAQGFIYVALQSGVVAAYRALDAAPAWETKLTAVRPFGSHADLLLVADAGAIQALGAADGKVRWRAPLAPLNSPFLVQDGWVIVSAGPDIVALRAADGSEAWRHAGPPLSDRPTIAGDRLFMPHADGVVRLLDLQSGSERWARRVGGTPSEILSDGNRIYLGSGDRNFYCLDAESGRISWRFRIGALVRGAAAANATHVFAASLDNLVRAFDRGDGERAWSIGVPYRPMSGPILAGDSLLVPGSAAELPVVDTARGATTEKLTLPSALAMPPGIGQSPDGLSVLAMVLGTMSTGWSLAVFDSSLSLPIVPLTVLPGEVVPLPTFAK